MCWPPWTWRRSLRSKRDDIEAFLKAFGELIELLKASRKVAA